MEPNTQNSNSALTNSELWTLGIGLALAVLLFIFAGKISAPPDKLTEADTQSAAAAQALALPPQTTTQSPQQTTSMGKNISTDSHLQIYDEQVGTGSAIKSGQTAIVNYTGMLANGTVFDASANHGGPASFQIGVGKVIKGWDIGLVGMKIGGKRKLIISPEYAYGNQQVATIPPNSILTFEVELVGVK